MRRGDPLLCSMRSGVRFRTAPCPAVLGLRMALRTLTALTALCRPASSLSALRPLSAIPSAVAGSLDGTRARPVSTRGVSHSSSATMTSSLDQRAQAVLDYWLGDGWEMANMDDTRPDKRGIWFQGGPEVDAEIVSRFKPDCEALLRGDYDAWQRQPLEALAGIIVGDQLARNVYRGTARMYAADPKVLAWSRALLDDGIQRLSPIQRVWVLMPLMHSEALEDQDECVAQFTKLAEQCTAEGWQEMARQAQENVKYAAAHRDVVAKWGRFPHRNAILGRDNTPEEASGMAAGAIPKW